MSAPVADRTAPVPPNDRAKTVGPALPTKLQCGPWRTRTSWWIMRSSPDRTSLARHRLMFCRNCGSKTLVGDHFCTTCAQAQRSPSATESVTVPVLLEESETPDVESRAVDQAARAEVPLTQPAEKPSYCRHSPSERGALGRYGQDGSEICMGCRLPYAPGSPGSGLRPAVGRSGPSARPGKKPSHGLFKVWVPIAALALVAGLVWFSLGSRGQEQQSGTKAAACARVQTLTSQLGDIQEQIRKMPIDMNSFAARQELERQKVPLKAELVVQNKCVRARRGICGLPLLFLPEQPKQ